MLLSGYLTSKSISLFKKYVPKYIDKKIDNIKVYNDKVLKEYEDEMSEIKKEIKELENNKTYNNSNIDKINELKRLKETYIVEEVSTKDKMKLK